jgi:cytochrome b
MLASAEGAGRRVRVWDVPVRLFHWAVVALFAFQIWSGETGGNAMQWHLYAGYGVLTLVLFRVLWGLFGSTHARFASFARGPAACLRYARRLFSRRPAPSLGHNPLGGWMVVLLLGSLALQTITGLFANDQIATQGPLAALVSDAWSDRLSSVHVWNFYVLLGLVGLHIAAVLYHWLAKKENLIGAMISGVKRVPDELVEPSAARFAGPWRALVLFAAALLAVYLVVQRPF